MMGVLAAMARGSFARAAAYRYDVWLRVVGQLVMILIQVTVWKSVMAHDAQAGELDEMVTYAIVSTCVSALHPFHMLRMLDERLRSGDVIIDMTRPLGYPLVLLGQSLGTMAFQLLFTVIPTLGISLGIYRVLPPVSALHAWAFVAAVLLALIIAAELAYLVALLSFWVLTTLVFEWLLKGLRRVLSGAFVPLWFFPAGLGAVAGALPFRFLNFVPVSIYLGRVPVESILPTLSVGLLWAMTLGLLAASLWTASMRRVVVQGG
jgi:viologen exporter family transport system permease protein